MAFGSGDKEKSRPRDQGGHKERQLRPPVSLSGSSIVDGCGCGASMGREQLHVPDWHGTDSRSTSTGRAHVGENGWQVLEITGPDAGAGLNFRELARAHFLWRVNVKSSRL